MLSRLLDDLCASGIVSAYNYFGSAKKDTVYQLCDFYTLFYLRFVKGRSGRDEHFWTLSIDNTSRRAWAGYTFELLCKYHIAQLRRAIGISDVLTECSTWFHKQDGRRGCQIDLVIARRDEVINLCEMKYSAYDYEITPKYSKELRERCSTFRSVTKTRYALHTTLVTPWGLRLNANAGVIDQTVNFEHLFADLR